jgi:hypothetical protein
MQSAPTGPASSDGTDESGPYVSREYQCNCAGTRVVVVHDTATDESFHLEVPWDYARTKPP